MPYDDSLRVFWGRAGYRTDLGSCATGKPPPKPFIRLFHLTSAEHAIDNIVNQRIKIARFEDLNDPFELRALEFRDKSVRTLVKNFGAAFGETTGLVSFSEDWTSPVMWGHYAKSHHGICLGFDVRRSIVRKVQYRSKRLEVEFSGDDQVLTLSPKMQRTLLRTKCREWAYERERRMLVPFDDATQNGDLYFCPFSEKLVLRQVILGEKCDRSLPEIRDMVSRFPDVSVFKARLAWKFFKVVPVESSVP